MKDWLALSKNEMYTNDYNKLELNVLHPGTGFEINGSDSLYINDPTGRTIVLIDMNQSYNYLPHSYTTYSLLMRCIYRVHGIEFIMIAICSSPKGIVVLFPAEARGCG